MKYNLGADATAAEGSIGLHGLLYQWGRKDPFIGPRTYASTGTDFAPTTNAAGHEWKTILNTTAIASIGQNTNAGLWYTWALSDPFSPQQRDQTKDWAARADEYKYQHDNLWGNYSTDPKAYPNQSFGKKRFMIPVRLAAGPSCGPVDQFHRHKYCSGSGSRSIDRTCECQLFYNNGWRFYYYYGKKDRYAFYPYIITRSPIDGQFTTGNSGFYWSSSETSWPVIIRQTAMGLYAVNKAYGAPLADRASWSGQCSSLYPGDEMVSGCR